MTPGTQLLKLIQTVIVRAVWFTEGFDTRDLQHAKELLAELPVS
jgi:hypothetical protein